MKFIKVILVMTLSLGMASYPVTSLAAETCNTDAECKALIAKNKEEQAAKQNEKAAYKIEGDNALEQLATIKQDIDEVQTGIESKELELAQTQTAIETKEVELEASASKIMDMIGRKQKENNQPQILMLIFSADSLTTLTKTLDFLTKMSNNEKEVIDELEIEFNTLRQIKTDLEIQKINLDAMMVELDEMKEAKESILDAARAKEAEAEASLEALAASADDIQRQRDIMNQPPPTPSNNGGGSNTGGSDTGGGDAGGSDNDGGSSTPKPSSGFVNPVTMDSTLTAHFMSPTYYYELGSWHLGTDLWSPARYGAPIMAIADGWVLGAGYYGSFGNLVAIGHNVNGTKYVSLYAHLDSYNVSVGQYVYASDVIGGMGGSGGYPVHLHIEVAYRDYFTTSRATREATNIDPLRVIPGGYAESWDAW